MPNKVHLQQFVPALINGKIYFIFFSTKKVISLNIFPAALDFFFKFGTILLYTRDSGGWKPTKHKAHQREPKQWK
jgi:hypothetical protein